MLARASRAVWIFRQVRRTFFIAIGPEELRRFNFTLKSDRAIVHIGLNEKFAVFGEQARHLNEKVVRHHHPLLVPLFPPRVGKVQVNHRKNAVGPEPRQRVFRVVGKRSHAVPEPALFEARIDNRAPLSLNLEPKDRRIRRGGGAFNQEPTTPMTDFDLECRPAHQFAHVNALPLGEARRVSIRFRSAIDLGRCGQAILLRPNCRARG